MPIVALKDIVDALEMVSDQCQAFLNVDTGEVVMLMEFDEEKPDVESDEFLPLPDQFDVEDRRILDSFCEQVEDPKQRSELLRAIRGPGAFRRFKALADRFSLVDAWYQHRQRELEAIATEWCGQNGIGYTIRGEAADPEKR